MLIDRDLKKTDNTKGTAGAQLTIIIIIVYNITNWCAH